MSDTSDTSDTNETLAWELRTRARAASRCVFLLDYDGTLMPFAATPAAARPDRELLGLLGTLAAAHETWIISGRGKDDLDAMFGHLPVGLGAEHGAWTRPWGSHGVERWQRLIPSNDSAARVLSVLLALVEKYPGSLIEQKDTSVAWHYRLAAPRPDQQALARVEAELRSLATAHDGDLLTAVLAFEVRARGAHKGLVVELAARQRPFADAFVLVAGDDVTDADLFDAAPAHAVRLAVGDRLAGATHRIGAPPALRALLAQLVAP